MARSFVRRMCVQVPIVALALSLLPAIAGGVAPTPGNGRIAFDDWQTGQIYTVNPDGTGLVQLTDTGPNRWAGDPSWSPDGSHIVFEQQAHGRVLLWMMNADGSDKHLLADDRQSTFSFEPEYTPDGQRVVFYRCWQFDLHDELHPDGGLVFTCRIFSIAVDGTDRQGITATHPPLEVFDFDPTVSPDGSSVAFRRSNHNYDGIKSQIYVAGIDGSDPHPLTPPALEAWYPQWSPDGHHIVFSSNCCRSGHVLGANGYVMDADGTNVARLTDTPFPNNDTHLTYSPDGTQIVFASDRDAEPTCPPCTTDMFIMDADGSNETMVDLAVEAPHDFSWGTAPLLSSSISRTIRSVRDGESAHAVALVRRLGISSLLRR
jgi:Tol biopolymer transport system component